MYGHPRISSSHGKRAPSTPVIASAAKQSSTASQDVKAGRLDCFVALQAPRNDGVGQCSERAIGARQCTR